MPKISSYPVLSRPERGASVVLASKGKNYKRNITDAIQDGLRNRFMLPLYKNEFWSNLAVTAYGYGIDPWSFLTIVSGTSATRVSVADHPGIVRWTSGAAANTGFAMYFYYTSDLLIGGKEATDLIFSLPSNTALVVRFGFGDNFVNAAPPVDGIWLNIAGLTLSGKTRNNSAESTTGTTYALSTATWYRMRIEVNATASRVDFTLYSAAGAVLWTDFLTTNIPTATGREIGHGIQAYKTTVTATALIDLDFISLNSSRVLSR